MTLQLINDVVENKSFEQLKGGLSALKTPLHTAITKLTETK